MSKAINDKNKSKVLHVKGKLGKKLREHHEGERFNPKNAKNIVLSNVLFDSLHNLLSFHSD